MDERTVRVQLLRSDGWTDVVAIGPADSADTLRWAVRDAERHYRDRGWAVRSIWEGWSNR